MPSEPAPSSLRRVWKRSSPSNSSVTTCIAGVSLEAADPRRRPVGRERPADDAAHGERPPVTAVVGRAAVVAHDEDLALGDADRLREVAATAAAARAGERLTGELAVADDVSVADGHGVTADC